jgi:hypothetical protein
MARWRQPIGLAMTDEEIGRLAVISRSPDAAHRAPDDPLRVSGLQQDRALSPIFGRQAFGSAGRQGLSDRLLSELHSGLRGPQPPTIFVVNR